MDIVLLLKISIYWQTEMSRIKIPVLKEFVTLSKNIMSSFAKRTKTDTFIGCRVTKFL